MPGQQKRSPRLRSPTREKNTMEISVNERRQIRLTHVYEPIELVSPDGETLIIAMRDGGFEIGVGSVQPPNNTLGFSFYRTCDGEIEPMAMEDAR